MKIKIYSVNEKKVDAKNLLFINLNNYRKATGKDYVAKEDYEKVFEGEVPTSDLEEIFSIFNMELAKYPDYHGHSMSVSDIVQTEDGNFYFCDSVGFKKIDFR